MAELSDCLKSYCNPETAFLAYIITIEVLVSKEMNSRVNILDEVCPPMSTFVLKYVNILDKVIKISPMNRKNVLDEAVNATSGFIFILPHFFWPVAYS